jgi:diguanylate cyclase (GGDEF)-like protein
MRRLSVNQYCAAVSVAGLLAAVAVVSPASVEYIAHQPVTFALLAAGVGLGEMLPVKIPRRGNDEEIVLSTSFSLALLLSGGLGPALIAQGTASVVQDFAARRPLPRVFFNLGQYTLSLTAAQFVMARVASAWHVGAAHPFSGSDLPAVLTCAAAFFVVNTVVVGVAVAIYQEVPIVRYFRNNLTFVVVTGSVLAFLSPLVIAAEAYSVVLIPLFLVPLLVIQRAGRESLRSEHAARHDSLTGHFNRGAFQDYVNEVISETTTAGSVLLMDLDRFKDVNDTLGHHYGDLLLKQVARRVSAELRDGEVLARLGGDEFAIFSNRAGADAVLALAQAVADSLSAPFELEHFVVDTEASVGVSLFPQDGTDVEMLLQRADVAMYRAKATHTDVALYDERYDDHSPAKLALAADLRKGTESGEIVAWYQPELDLATEQSTAVEALVRWAHPDLGLLPPGAFLDIAERTNLIKPLTQRVLELALAQAAAWHALGIDITVAVNVSARVLADRTFPARVAHALAEADVPSHRLKLEVTESTLMVEPELALSVLTELSALGIELSIDDFGTGYSSLAYLAKLPVSEVKIDRAFVGKMAAGSREGIIVGSTVDLAHHLGLRAVAEGVEDLALIADLQAIGCDMAQGYAISRPMDSQEATAWLLRSRRFLPRQIAA